MQLSCAMCKSQLHMRHASWTEVGLRMAVAAGTSAAIHSRSPCAGVGWACSSRHAASVEGSCRLGAQHVLNSRWWGLVVCNELQDCFTLSLADWGECCCLQLDSEAVVRDYKVTSRRLVLLDYNATLTTAVEAPRQPKRHFDQIQVRPLWFQSKEADRSHAVHSCGAVAAAQAPF